MPKLSTPTPQRYSRISGIGGYRSEHAVSNDEIVGPINSSDEWIRQRTGIITRHRAGPDVQLIDMAEEAGSEAIANAGLKPSDIGGILIATVTFPYPTPSAASLLTERLGTGPIPAWDISAACAGYCYGIAQADGLVRAGTMDNVLVIGAEKLSDIIDPTDRSISFILGDGAGAVVVSHSDEPGIAQSVWGSKGENWETIRMTNSLLDLRDDRENAPWPTLRQDGPSVFRWAVWDMAEVAQEALDAAGVQASDLAAFVPHQANMRIIDELAKQLKLPDTVKIGRDIADNGNTSSASIPLATERLLRENPELHGGLALQIGFGAGLVYGAQVVVLP
ncbi:beta-ketoacyl-ACP synthase III [Brevibacterium sp. 5221]|uniref:Beta-ketoacyl-ACP synthase III n=1 Tax=Brevibacterium rongguiense TaxID=2695267 RepID=A0A6N9H502_9MICO|nr:MULTISPECIES: beta-ketoacyl-ACP synthase III [Brevibacterium]MYM19015.1 beta-ketoacyl-ACP synthase III [Brevibacterium rongguiense]WAL40696.1 ketoacyl-ACP synthase III [Brevibacterium sp. BRM-1]